MHTLEKSSNPLRNGRKGWHNVQNSSLETCLPRVSCLPASAFTGQAYHRLAAQVTEEQLEQAQIEIARAAAQRFELSTDVLAFDTTNFDTHIATTTPGELARRGHAKM